jgi:NADH-quinone oxidoreductase subunit N
VSQTLQVLLPEIVLAAVACSFLLGAGWKSPPKQWGPLALLSLAIAAAAQYSASEVDFEPALSPMLAHTSLTIGIRWCCLVAGVLFVLMSQTAQSESKTAAEFYGLLLLIVAGMMLVASANELILLFLSLELISVPTYVLLYLGRHDFRSQEAAIKYFLLSVLSAAILLYGFAFVYGLTGTTQLSASRSILAVTYPPQDDGLPRAGASVLGIVALLLVFAGLGFKIAAVPFHFYAPDVYEGTSTFNAGLLSIAPKAAGLIALVRVASETLVGFETTGQQLALILAAITMTGGNCLALLQTNLRRLLAYSGIAHAGYMLIGLAVGFWESWNPTLRMESVRHGRDLFLGLPGGVNAALLYLLTYCIATAGLFAVLIYLARPGRQVDHIDELTGLGKTHPAIAVAAALFLFSLAGIPPLPGFWGKLAVFSSALGVRLETSDALFAMHPAFAALAVVGVLNAAIGAVYYLRLVAVMFLNDPLGAPRPGGGVSARAAVVITAVLVVALGILPKPIFDYLELSSQIHPVQTASSR